MTELASKLSPNMTRRPKDAETTFVGMPKRTKRVMSFLKRRQKEKEEGKEPLNKIGKVNIPPIFNGFVLISL